MLSLDYDPKDLILANLFKLYIQARIPLCGMDTLMEPCRVRHVSVMHVGHTCCVYFKNLSSIYVSCPYTWRVCEYQNFREKDLSEFIISSSILLICRQLQNTSHNMSMTLNNLKTLNNIKTLNLSN